MLSEYIRVQAWLCNLWQRRIQKSQKQCSLTPLASEATSLQSLATDCLTGVAITCELASLRLLRPHSSSTTYPQLSGSISPSIICLKDSFEPDLGVGEGGSLHSPHYIGTLTHEGYYLQQVPQPDSQSLWLSLTTPQENGTSGSPLPDYSLLTFLVDVLCHRRIQNTLGRLTEARTRTGPYYLQLPATLLHL